jgi:GNAT superfamily N-acetyltransferase
MNIEIREVKENDYSEIVSLWNHELGSRTVTAENISERFERMKKDENYKTFVGVFENKVVGCITTVQIMALEYEVGYLKINGLVVKEDFQKKGIGTKLIQHAENYALEKGLSYLILNCGFQRKTAHDFYEANGFDKLSYCFTKKVR